MKANSHVRYLTAAAISLSSVVFIAHTSAAETIETDEYLYIGVEAEDFDAGTGHERWVVTDSGTPAIADDPDGNHSDGSSGGVYLELLPDLRVTAEDPFLPDPGSFWAAGQGPSADYTINFPEEGRYYIHGRAYSTGAEDNGLHVGLNGAWPESARAMQFCNRNAWKWRSAQRHSGPNGASCGVNHTIYLDIPTAGEHVVSISAREDGFELDRFALIKDKSGNTRVCTATNINDVSCKNGSIEVEDENVDLRLLATVDADQADVGETINFTFTLENLDAFDTATDIEIAIDAAGATITSADSTCDTDGSSSVCTVASHTPTSADKTFEFSLVVSEAGEYVVEATASSFETDDFPANNTVTQSVIFDDVDTSTELSVEMSATDTELEVGDSTELTVVAANTGEFDSMGGTATITLPAGVSASSTPASCLAGIDNILCTLDVEANESVSLVFGLATEDAGESSAEVSISATNDQDLTNNNAAVALVVVAAAMGGETGGTDGATGDTAGAGNANGGAAELALLLMLLLAVSARLYWLNQRKLVVLRK